MVPDFLGFGFLHSCFLGYIFWGFSLCHRFLRKLTKLINGKNENLVSLLFEFILFPCDYIKKVHHRGSLNTQSSIQAWMILRSSYINFAWVTFEPTTTKFQSDAPANWAIIPWVQIALRTNFVHLFQFNLLFSVIFHFGYCLRQSPLLFNRSIVEVITWL